MVKKWWDWLIILFPIVVLLAAMRANGVKNEQFMITAHIYTGLLAGLFLGTRRFAYLYLAVTLTAVEAIAFFALK